MKIGRKRWLRIGLYSMTVAVCTLVTNCVGSSSLGRWAELRTYDLRFKMRGPLAQSEAAPVSILAVDEEALSRIRDPFVLWQGIFARVISQLAAGRAGVIGVDFIFGDISKYDPEGQQALSRALLQAGACGVPVILAYQVRPAGVEQSSQAVRLAAVASGHILAFVNLTTDSDDFVRRQLISAIAPDRQIEPGFALAISDAYAKKYHRSFSPPVVDDDTILINFREPGHFRQVSFAEAARASSDGNDRFFEDNFQDRIVLIGRVGGPGDEDLHSTPQYFWGNRGNAKLPARTAGVVIHANTIATLLENSRIRPLAARQERMVVFLVVFLMSLICIRYSPIVAPALSASVMLAYGAIACLWFFRWGWWLPVVAPVTGAILAVSSLEILDFICEGREKKRLRELFCRYVNNEVIEKILESPDSLALQGEKREITVLFADIKNFTARSENLKPETLVRDLIEYFTVMVRVIQSHNGMVDKFIGDGIMAIFGAPIEDRESALRAVQAAQSMCKALEDLNMKLVARDATPIAIGIGIHTGEAVVGNIGSDQKMEYTAIGDVVNVASRIEGLTRKLDAEILISGNTFHNLKGRIVAKSLGDEAVKGRKQTVAVYAVSATEGSCEDTPTASGRSNDVGLS